MEPNIFPALFTALAMILFFVVSAKVGSARTKYGIKAPATSGHEMFERALRVQMNTLEQVVFFLPSLWLFFGFATAAWAQMLGIFLASLWLLARVVYMRNYNLEPKTRVIPFAAGLGAACLLLLGAIVGIVTHLFT